MQTLWRGPGTSQSLKLRQQPAMQSPAPRVPCHTSSHPPDVWANTSKRWRSRECFLVHSAQYSAHSCAACASSGPPLAAGAGSPAVSWLPVAAGCFFFCCCSPDCSAGASAASLTRGRAASACPLGGVASRSELGVSRAAGAAGAPGPGGEPGCPAAAAEEGRLGAGMTMESSCCRACRSMAAVMEGCGKRRLAVRRTALVRTSAVASPAASSTKPSTCSVGRCSTHETLLVIP